MKHSHSWKIDHQAQPPTWYKCECGNWKHEQQIKTVNGHEAIQSEFYDGDGKRYYTKIEAITVPGMN